MSRWEMGDPEIRAQIDHHKGMTERGRNNQLNQHYKPAIPSEALDDTTRKCITCDELWPCEFKRAYVAWETEKELLQLMFRDPPYTGPRPYELGEE